MCGASGRKQSCSAIHGRRSAHALTDDIACTDRERGDPDYGADPVHRQQRSEREHAKRKHLHGNLLVKHRNGVDATVYRNAPASMCISRQVA